MTALWQNRVSAPSDLHQDVCFSAPQCFWRVREEEEEEREVVEGELHLRGHSEQMVQNKQSIPAGCRRNGSVLLRAAGGEAL